MEDNIPKLVTEEEMQAMMAGGPMDVASEDTTLAPEPTEARLVSEDEMLQMMASGGQTSAVHSSLPISDTQSLESSHLPSAEEDAVLDTEPSMPMGPSVDEALSPLLGAIGQQPGPQQPQPPHPMVEDLQRGLGPGGNPVPPGVYNIPPQIMPQVTQILGNTFTSLQSNGVMANGRDRMAFAMAVMRLNDELPSTRKATLMNQVMKDGRIVPELLPPAWYEAQGLGAPESMIDPRSPSQRVPENG